jgi:hypothetical protein
MHKENFLRSCYRKVHQATILGLFALFLLSSCNLQEDPGIILINPLNAIEGKVFLSDFTDNITYIPLDNEILFQHPNRIEITEELFIMATYPAGIMSYDRQGRFLNKIGARGRGPGEYRTGLYFTLNPENKLVYIYDNNRIITYTFNGELVRQFSTEKFDGSFYDIAFLNDKIYLAGVIQSGFSKYNWLKIDTLGNYYSHKYNSVPPFESTSGSSGGFFESNKRLFYWNNFNDTIFMLQDSLYQPAMLFAQGDFRYPHGDVPDEIDYRKYLFTRNIIKTDSYLFLFYYFENLLQSGFIKNKDGVINVIGKIDGHSGFDIPGIPNDIDQGPAFQPFYCFQENGEEYLLGWVHAFKLKAHVVSDAFKNSTPKHPEKKKELEQLAASLDENDNPVLMLVKLKP